LSFYGCQTDFRRQGDRHAFANILPVTSSFCPRNTLKTRKTFFLCGSPRRFALPPSEQLYAPCEAGRANRLGEPQCDSCISDAKMLLPSFIPDPLAERQYPQTKGQTILSPGTISSSDRRSQEVADCLSPYSPRGRRLVARKEVTHSFIPGTRAGG
jgi:hypothetical protein